MIHAVVSTANSAAACFFLTEWLLRDDGALRAKRALAAAKVPLGALFLLNGACWLFGEEAVEEEASIVLRGTRTFGRVVLAALSFSCACYFDTRRLAAFDLTPVAFLSVLWRAFLLAFLPAFPFLAVGVSFALFILVSLLEFASLPTSWLNAPIYYGTLYGPFAFLYWYAKKRVLEGGALPTTKPIAKSTTA